MNNGLAGYWHCEKCEWEGNDPSCTTYRHMGEVYADEIWCPECVDGGDLETGRRPEAKEIA
jgi:hypothetical protein